LKSFTARRIKTQEKLQKMRNMQKICRIRSRNTTGKNALRVAKNTQGRNGLGIGSVSQKIRQGET